jgi:hypothetical protein
VELLLQGLYTKDSMVISICNTDVSDHAKPMRRLLFATPRWISADRSCPSLWSPSRGSEVSTVPPVPSLFSYLCSLRISCFSHMSFETSRSIDRTSSRSSDQDLARCHALYFKILRCGWNICHSVVSSCSCRVCPVAAACVVIAVSILVL